MADKMDDKVRPVSIAGVCSYPESAAATRFRAAQFIEPLAFRNIRLELIPFLNQDQFSSLYGAGGSPRHIAQLFSSILGRIRLVGEIRRYDLLFVQREAMFLGPAVFEWLYRLVGSVPMVLDLDDATYVPYVSPSFGRLGSALKFFGKTDRLIKSAAVVTCGNRFIAEYVEGKGTRAVVVPTVVDNAVFCPVENKNEIPVLGWIGTHSTFQFLERLFPLIERLAEKHRFRLLIVGSGDRKISIPGVDVEMRRWQLEREVADFQSIDIGLYPIFPGGSANEEWIKGKSGFKAIQYMAIGIPFVMSPVGVCAEIGVQDKTHLNAGSLDDWYNHLDNLLGSRDVCSKLGAAGRRYSLQHFDMKHFADVLAQTFRSVVNEKSSVRN